MATDVFEEPLDLEIENMDALTDEQYAALYHGKLSERHASYPIYPDSRMWKGEQPAAAPAVKRRAVA